MKIANETNFFVWKKVIKHDYGGTIVFFDQLPEVLHVVLQRSMSHYESILTFVTLIKETLAVKHCLFIMDANFNNLETTHANKHRIYVFVITIA